MKLFVKYTAKCGKAEEFVKFVKDSGILESILREDGCIAYDYYLGAFKSDTILLVEEWEDKAKQEKHLSSPHMTLLMKEKPKYIDKTELL